MSDVIVSKQPNEYLKQGLSHCGVYTAKGILEAYDKFDFDQPEELHNSLLGRLTGSLTPKMLKNVLETNGLNSTIGIAQGSDKQKIEIIKEEILNDRPVIVLIGNGYKKDGSFSKFKKSYMSHWISVWGFNDETKVFYLYDSCVPRELYSKNIPIGNIERSYERVVEDWSGSFYRNLLAWSAYLYIKVDEK
ncbi:hypothetical protein KC717_06705 [Candidatus Dojkabacteria bacterium]|uniref:Peptidase C39-like domain-containing protein n=1 Tax=Candidatus Dojkabacteria bacterium TaxID=2099670 RepID=A0A955RLF4_9BACT|nr:hypothetical protein [Candidatus Dojkabacteria bacterium]